MWAGRKGQVDGIELDDLAGLGGFRGLWQALSEAAFCRPFSGPGGLADGRHGLDGTAPDEVCQDVPDGRLRYLEALLDELHDDLGLAPHRPKVVPEKALSIS